VPALARPPRPAMPLNVPALASLEFIPVSVRWLLGGSVVVFSAMLAASVDSIVVASIGVFILTTGLALPLLNLASEWACLLAGTIGALSALGVGVPWLLCRTLPKDGLCGCFDASSDRNVRVGATVSVFIVSLVVYALVKRRGGR